MSATNPPRRALSAPLMSSIAREADQLQASIRRMFDHPLAGAAQASVFAEPIGWFPAVEITETAHELTICAELPGLDPEDVHVDLEGEVLTLRGEKREARSEEGKDMHYHLEERCYGAFQRSFMLPAGVDRDHITADFAKCVLTLHLPKSFAARSRGHEIPVVSK
jgi:HSP20 family protein